MNTNFAQRAKEIVAKNGSNKKAALAELDALRREQFQYEQSINTDRELDRGIDVEHEHKPTLDFLKKYHEEHGKFPRIDTFAKSIAVDHLEDSQKNPNMANQDPSSPNETYYKSLIEGGLADEVQQYAQGGFMHPMNIPLQQLEAIRNGFVAGGNLMSSGTPMDSTNRYATNEYKSGGTIHINPENRGKFNATKERTGKTTEELTHSSNPLTRKRAIFAQNAAKWKHEDGGQLLDGVNNGLSKSYIESLNDGSLNQLAFGGTVLMKPGRPYGGGVNVYDGNNTTGQTLNKDPFPIPKDANGNMILTQDVPTTTDTWVNSFVQNNPQFTPSKELFSTVGNVLGAPINYATGTLSGSDASSAMLPVIGTTGRAFSALTKGSRFAPSAGKSAGIVRSAGINRNASRTIGGAGTNSQYAKKFEGSIDNLTSAAAPKVNSTFWSDLADKTKGFMGSAVDAAGTVLGKVNPYNAIGASAVSAGLIGSGMLADKIQGMEGNAAINQAKQNIAGVTAVPNIAAIPTVTLDTTRVAQPASVLPAPQVKDTAAVAPVNVPETLPIVNGAAAEATQNTNAPLSVRNNNPGNLVDPSTGKFRTFATPEEGQAALDRQLGLYLGGTSGSYRSRFGTQPVTPERLMEVYAPSTAQGNSPETTRNYAAFVSKALGINPGDVIPNTPEARAKLAQAITEFEGGAYKGDGTMRTPQTATPIQPAAAGIPTEAERIAREEAVKMNALTGTMSPRSGQASTTLDPSAGLQIPAQQEAQQKGDWMQYAPAAFNLMAGIGARRGANMPTNVNFGSISPQVIAPEQLSQAPILQNVNQQYGSAVNALSGMGNSAAAMRAGLSGLSLAGAQGGGNAIADINMKNAALRGEATKFNAISAGDVAKFNAQMGAEAKQMNLANQERNLNTEAAFRQSRLGSLGAFATNLGQVAAEKKAGKLEQDRLRALMNMYGYNQYGEHPKSVTPKKASDRTVIPAKPAETKSTEKKPNPSVSLKRGGYLKFK